jgi:hypothetical protein
MNYRAISPTADRDIALMGLLAALLASLMALGAALMLGAAITTVGVGGPWQIPGVTTWVSGLFTVIGDPSHPGAALMGLHHSVGRCARAVFRGRVVSSAAGR